MYIKTSVKKPTGASPGASAPKEPNVTIIDIDDVLSFPQRDFNGVKMEGNFVLKADSSMIQVYMTPSKSKASYESEGEEDSVQFKQKFEGEHPGNDLAINEFIQNWTGRNVIIIYGSCTDKFRKVLGSKCAPLQLKPSMQDDNDARKQMLVFEQHAATGFVPGHYLGDLVLQEAQLTGSKITATLERGTQYRLTPLNTTENIEFNQVDHADGTIITLIGNGDEDPPVLKSGPGTNANIVVLLKNGADWTGFRDAAINLQVFDGGSKNYILEVSRS
ncbi:hypothetical protein [Flavobacterium sp. NKUCC04_CG]|uniref:hypothetical protein n=1 Tax=Flavobacterium sp. NKUCC04_CG TaxID=2842121 RepID=UPI001C5B9295|nr:hypothetical protein [Flavobacterium sp. NKUCC04_CG]MBW3519517.1 hypothetical protein [Flavobacterium sp. NKUCC04_CG]